MSNDLPCACTALRKASRALTRAYDDALAPAGLSVVQFALLRHLQRHGELPLSRLAELLVMERTSLYRALEPLERRGWVAVAAGDRGKAKLARLLSDGARAITAATPAWRDLQSRIIAGLGADDWPAAERLLARLTTLGQEQAA